MRAADKCVASGIVAFGLLLSSCDPGALIRHEYILEIANVTSGEPVANAEVTSWPENRRYAGESADDYLDRIANEGATSIDRSPMTNEAGQVVLTLNSGIICAGEQCTLPAYTDEVTGEVFLVQIETEGSSEILTVEMVVGNRVSGTNFAVTVRSIGEPQTLGW